MINEDLIKNLPEGIGLDGFDLYTVQDFAGLKVYLKTTEPLILDHSDVAAGNYLSPLATQIQTLLNNTKYVKRFRDELESENEALKAQIKELEKYKIHFDLEKEKISKVEE